VLFTIRLEDERSNGKGMGTSSSTAEASMFNLSYLQARALKRVHTAQLGVQNRPLSHTLCHLTKIILTG
jgi:hypothetical protein